MVNADIPPYRKTAYELRLESQQQAIVQYLTVLGRSLQMQLPTVSLPEPDSIFNSCPPSPQEHGAGSISHEEIFAGHGPRFVARYNLAESVGERQRLLNLLPQTSGMPRGFPEIEVLLSTYAMEDHSYGYERSQADNSPELLALMDRLTQEPLQEIVANGPWPLRLPLFHFAPSAENFATKTHYVRHSESHFSALVAAPEIQGYYVFSLSKAASHQLGRWRVREERVVRWMPVEDCWLDLPTSYKTGSSYIQAVMSWMGEIGMPPYVHVPDEDLATTYAQLAERHVKLMAPLYEMGFKERRAVRTYRVTLPGVAGIAAERHYLDWHRVEFTFDIPRPETESPLRLKLAHLPYGQTYPNFAPHFSVKDNHGFHYSSGDPRVHPRERARLVSLIQQFLAADPAELIVTQTPAE